MRCLSFILCLLFYIPALYGQKEMAVQEGVVTYVSSQNVYVKFASTENIQKGDTLFAKKGEQMLPLLVVKDKSSTSCVCGSSMTEKAKVGDVFYARTMVEKKAEKANDKKTKVTALIAQDSAHKAQNQSVLKATGTEFKQKIRGRISAAAYSNFYGDEQTNRMRYTLSFQGDHLGNSRFSTENYITFRHTLGQWSLVKANLNDALKIYSLSVKYDFNKRSNISLGRKINPRISSMGAIDGAQAEIGLKYFTVGAIVGSRPDYTDYSLDLNLFQVGAYISHASQNEQKSRETTFAVVEQRNRSKTDRRFVYFQHTNALTKNLNLFGSFEVDMYKIVNDRVSNALSLTNLLISLQYRISRKLSFSFAYDNRKNIIYYESYKSFIDRLIENETRQGLRLGANYRLSKMITLGVNSSWRFQKSNINLSKNLNAYVNFSQLPWIKATASLSANILQTNYLDSKIYGFSISKDLVRGKLGTEFYGREVEYNYKNYENKIHQRIAGMDLSWNITHKLGFYVYFEGTFDKNAKPYNLLNTRIVQRF